MVERFGCNELKDWVGDQSKLNKIKEFMAKEFHGDKDDEEQNEEGGTSKKTEKKFPTVPKKVLKRILVQRKSVLLDQFVISRAKRSLHLSQTPVHSFNIGG